MEPAELRKLSYKYMGRVHYWAADCVTHGAHAPWGEHEIDYLVLARVPKGMVLTMVPNPEEVMATAWVSSTELKERMRTGRWSPWFRVICSELLFAWWVDLDRAWRHKPERAIRRFDAPPEHCKAGGCHDGDAATELASLYRLERALPWDSAGRKALTLAHEREARRRDLTSQSRSTLAAAANKQGGYGKVPTHAISKRSQLCRPSEVLAGLWLKLGPGVMSSNMPGDLSAEMRFCDEKLGQVSRSFAAVIRQLPTDMVLDIMVFYLVLRALDTIEDDMDTFKGNEKLKIEHLVRFGNDYLGDEQWSLSGVGEGDELALLEGFGNVSKVFNQLPPSSRNVIRDITIRMGQGMADNVNVDLGQGTADLAAYALYCHSVAGLVGEGLTRAFIVRGFEDASIAAQGELVWPFCKCPVETCNYNFGIANSMGLFLQKTNIIRDYLEDYADGRAFWPAQEWRRFARTDDLGEFARPTAHGAGLGRYPSAYSKLEDPQGARIVGKGVGTQALACLNFLVADALELVPDCLDYLRRLKTVEIFRFSAIPQVMAIATLEACFDNPQVFTGVVKIRKGLAAQMILECNEVAGVEAWFYQFAKSIARRCPPEDPSRDKVLKATARICELTRKGYNGKRNGVLLKSFAAVSAVGAAAAYYYGTDELFNTK